jgi:hypothetical protein
MNFQNHYNLPDQLVALVDRELNSGESVVWVSQPIPRRMARTALPSVLFGIPWTAFAIFWTAMAGWGTWSKPGAGWFRLFPFWGVPFILVGFGMLSSSYWAYRRAKQTAYVLTNRRAIIISVGWRKNASIQSFEPNALTDLQRKEKPDGSRDLIFTNDIRTGSRGHDYSTEVGFIAR